MNILYLIFYIAQAFFILHLVFPVFLKLFSAEKSKLKRVSHNEIDYGIIVTAYEQTHLIKSVVNSILELNYKNYLVYIVADNCDISDLNFSDSKIILLRPEDVLSSNIKSHFYAINHFRREHECITIIDSDNLVEPEYLNELNIIFDLGYEAIQGVREAKNLNSEYANLDGAGDIYYRYLDRKLLFEAGSSASLAGSGMAFTTSLYKKSLTKYLNSTGAGFDKILQYEILQSGLRIAFAEKAIVYDEKTSKSDQLVKQRARWLNTWFKFFGLGINMFLTGIIKMDRNRFLFSIMLIRPPLFLVLAASFIFFLINLFLFPLFSILWVLFAGIFLFFFYKSLAYFKANERIYNSIKSAPKFIFLQFYALVKAKKANELSVATKHDSEIDLNKMDYLKKHSNEKN